ncbi:MAG TPA: hypothetical protein VIE41_01565 [Methylomirabilota bacterium]|jgi:hypothetical protein
MFGRNGAKPRPARNSRVEGGSRGTPDTSAAVTTLAVRPLHLVEEMRQSAQK